MIILAPTYWYQSPSPLKLMIDRMVCADGGNPDSTTTHGKDVAQAKRIEQQGWDYPKHLAGRVYGVVVHGDVAGVEAHRHHLTDWLDWMGLIDAGAAARLDRYIGYYQPFYHDSHDAQCGQARAGRGAQRGAQRVAVQEVVERRVGLDPGALVVNVAAGLCRVLAEEE